MSEDEDEEDGGAIRKPGMRTYKRKSRIATPPPIIDKGLQAMMDVDDGEFQCPHKRKILTLIPLLRPSY